MPAAQKLIRALAAALHDHADPAKSPAMQAYMKSSMPYLGIPTPVHRRICREVFLSYPLDSFHTWRDTILTLWRDARYREERYAAIALAGFRSYEDFRTLRALPLYKEMLTTGAWWDYVDAIATQQIGQILRKSPARMPALRLHPTLARPPRVLPAQGHRQGPAPVCPDKPERSTTVRA